MSVEEVEQIRRTSQTPVSLEKPVGDDDESEFGHFLEDESEPLPDEVAGLIAPQRGARPGARDARTSASGSVLELRFGLNGEAPCTLDEVGRAFNVTRERIRQIENHVAEEAPPLRRAQSSSATSPRLGSPDGRAWFDELAELLRIPSVSADPAHAARRRARGRVGLRASSATPAGQASRRLARPAARDRRDRAPRATPTRRRPSSATATSTSSRRSRSSSGRAIRSSPRSAAATSTAAARSTTRGSSTCCSRPRASSRSAGELPVNVRFCCDGEEETGGHSIVEFLAGRRARRRRGDHLRQRHDPPRAAGLQRRDARAQSTSTSRVRTGERDLHSGHLRRRGAERRSRARDR